MNSRRRFLNTLAAAGLSPLILYGRKPDVLPISCNSYTWLTFYNREGKEWWKDPDASAEEFSRSGIPAIEPNISSVEEAQRMIPVLRRYNIQMPSIYVGTELHTADKAAHSIETVLAIATEVKKHQTSLVITNPTPLQWGGGPLKSDAQLIEQAKNLEQLGKELRKMDMTLAYHTHDTEMMAGAREFHHVMQNTSSENVSFCFDVHWIFRGSGNSQVAVFDVLKMYGKRVAELHLRQSSNGVWTETFGEGDIDYARLAREMEAMKIHPHFVIEQCIESNSPNTMNGLEAHKADLRQVKEIFKNFL